MNTISVGGHLLYEAGEDLWVSRSAECGGGPVANPHAASVVLRRHGGLYQADVGDGSTSWHETAGAAIAAAERDCANRAARAQQEQLRALRREA